MKYLTQQEIQFMKDTGWSWTVFQCDEYIATKCKDYDDAYRIAMEQYGVNLDALLHKSDENEDSISLEYAAGYLLYTFFTPAELEAKTDQELLEWLKDMKYFFGWRKADESDARAARYDAEKLFAGTAVFTDLGDGDVWYIEKDE